MDTVHFLNLREFAVRGPVERGRRYVMCHSQVGDFKEDFFPMPDYGEDGSVIWEDVWRPPVASASEVLIAHGVENLRSRDTLFSGMVGLGFGHGDESRAPMFATLRRLLRWQKHGYGLSWSHASDWGMWDVPGVSYKNDRNYLLDVAQLRSMGITVDTTEVHLIDPFTSSSRRN